MVTIQHSNVELEDTSIDRVEAIYETIDETKMLDTPIERINQFKMCIKNKVMLFI